MMRLIRRSDCDRASGMLSEYLDGYLAPKDKAWIEGHLAGCPRCSDEMASLRATVSLLGQMPQAAARRSFLVPPRPVPVPVPVPVPAWGWRALRLGTAVATVLLAIVITADVVGLVRPTPRQLAPAVQDFQYSDTVKGGAMATPAPAEVQGELKGPSSPVGPVGPAGVAGGPPAPTTLTGEGQALVPSGARAPLPTVEDQAPLRAAVPEELKPRRDEESLRADNGTAAQAGATPTPAPAPQATPPPAPTPRLQAAGPAPQAQEEFQYARGNATPAPLPRHSLLQTTWPVQAGLAVVWLGLVALTGYLWRVRSKGARSARR